jgi:hypothetical protein
MDRFGPRQDALNLLIVRKVKKNAQMTREDGLGAVLDRALNG